MLVCRSRYRSYFFQTGHIMSYYSISRGKARTAILWFYLKDICIIYLDAGNIKYVLANGTSPYSDQFSRNFRHFLWMNNVIYIIDDLKPMKPVIFEWLWHPGNNPREKKDESKRHKWKFFSNSPSIISSHVS